MPTVVDITPPTPPICSVLWWETGIEEFLNHVAAYDLVLTAARICDPATGLDRNYDLAVNGVRIAAVGSGLASHARQVTELDGNLVTAGWVDLHVQVFERMTTFGLTPDNAGVVPA